MSKKNATRRPNGRGMVYSTLARTSVVPPVLNPESSTGETLRNLKARIVFGPPR
jgi:hypothetical protein